METPTTEELRSQGYLHWIINGLFTCLFVGVGFVTGMLFDEIEKQENRINQLPFQYVTKIEYSEDQDRLIHAIDAISQKLDANKDHTAAIIAENRRATEADYNRRMDKLERTITDILSRTGR